MGFFDFLWFVGDDKPAPKSAPAPARKFAPKTQRSGLTADKPRLTADKPDDMPAAKPAAKTQAAAPALQKPVEPWMPNPTARKLLEQNNFVRPEDKVAAAPPPPKGATKLTPYEQEVGPEEFDRITSLYSEGRKPRPQGPVVDRATVRTQMHSKPLTEDEYAALSGDQRAAIDFNTLLIAAREKDLSDNIKLDGDARTQYEKDIADIFGSDGGSALVAPATVKLLKDIKYSAKGQDLDSFLSLEAGIDMEELKNIKLPPLPQVKAYEPKGSEPGANPFDQAPSLLMPENREVDSQGFADPGRGEYGKVNTAENFNTAMGLAIRQSRGFIDTLMKNPDLPTYNLPDRYSAFNDPNFIPKTPGWGTGDLDEQFKSIYEQLSSKDFPGLDYLWGELDELQYSNDEKDQLMTYLHERANYEKNVGGTGTGKRSGEEMLKYLQMEG